MTERTIEDDNLLQNDVVKTAARHLAHSIAHDPAETRIQDFTRMITGETIERMQAFIDNCRERGELPETEQLMVNEAEAVAERSYEILHTWNENGEEPPETEEIATMPDEHDGGMVETLEAEEEDIPDQ